MESQDTMDFEQEDSSSSDTSFDESGQTETIQQIHDTSVFGEACQFKGDNLPTYGDVLRNIFFLYNRELKETKKSASLKSFVGTVAKEIIKIWERTQIPLYQLRSVKNKLSRAVDEYQRFNKHKSDSVNEYRKYVASLGTLFDIAQCKCDIQNSRCKCSDIKSKIPDAEKMFIIDQRTDRKFKLNSQQQSVKVLPIGISGSEISNLPLTSASEMSTLPEASTSEYIPSSDTDTEEPTAGASTSSHYGTNAIHLPLFAMECDRYGVSDRAASALLTSGLKDLNYTNIDGSQIIIDRNKIRREREKSRRLILQQRQDLSMIVVFSFDSRSDNTYAPETLDK